MQYILKSAALTYTFLLVCGVALQMNVANAQQGLDPSFGTGGKVVTDIDPASSEYVVKTLLQPDGKIIVVGYTSDFFTTLTPFFPIPTMARYNSNGTLDTTFAGQGFTKYSVLSYSTISDAMLLPDGKILAVGTLNATYPTGVRDYLLARFNSDGSLDSTFDGDGYTSISFSSNWDSAVGVGVQSDGRIIVGGQSTPQVGGPPPVSVILRYNTDGSRDLTFGTDDNGLEILYDMVPSSIAIQPDDKIIVAGANPLVTRLNSNGSTDTGFGTNGIATLQMYRINNLRLQPDGKVLLIGDSASSAPSDLVLSRLTSNGTVDFGFGTSGRVVTSFYFDQFERGLAVAVHSDGTIVASGVGYTPLPAERSNFAVVRYSPNGLVLGKTTLDFSSRFDIANSTLIQPDGKIVVAGYSYGSLSGFGWPLDGNIAVARFVDIPTQVISGIPFDFDGDRKSDVGIYRRGPAVGLPSYWYVVQSMTFLALTPQFGAGEDIIVPADYDGDTKTDFAVFRPSTGFWYTSLDAAINYGAFKWGQNGDIPVPGDYDRDGKADKAVYRPSNGTWYIVNSSNGVVDIRQFGGVLDKPVQADYDGDGKTDIAYVTTSGSDLIWNIIDSSTGASRAVQYGLVGDLTVQADYDGDGNTDIAVFRPSTGNWYTSLNPATGYGLVHWGQTGDVPAPADYDGDGKADHSVFRPANGNFYIRQSTDLGLRSMHWGQNGDLPIPSAYVR